MHRILNGLATGVVIKYRVLLDHDLSWQLIFPMIFALFFLSNDITEKKFPHQHTLFVFVEYSFERRDLNPPKSPPAPALILSSQFFLAPVILFYRRWLGRRGCGRS